MLRFNKFHALFSIIILILIIILHSPAYSMDPSDYDIIRSFPSPGPSPSGLAWDGEYLWVSDDSTDTIYKISSLDGSVVSSFDSPGSDPKDLAWDGTNLWAVEGKEVTMYKLNPASGDTMTSIHLDIYNPGGEATITLYGLAWDGSHLFYSYIITKDGSISFSNKIQKINPQNSEIDSLDCFSTNHGLAYDGNSLWYSYLRGNGYFNGGVVELEMPYYKPIKLFHTPGNYPTGLTWDGSYLWLADVGADSLYQIEIKQTEVVESLQVPVLFELYQNYPNPFNPSTTIIFSIPEQGFVSLSVYDITGQKVATLVDQHMSAGKHSVIFDGSDFGSGVYLYRFKSERFEKMGKMLLIK